MSNSENETKQSSKNTRGRPKAKKDVFIELIERFDQDKLNYIIEHEDECRTMMRSSCFDDDYNPFTIIRKYLKKSKDGQIHVKYRQNASAGRFHAIGSLSLQSMAREFRHTIAGDFYNDIDMKNAHPVILAFLCEERGIKCKQLNRYNRDRDRFLSEISEDRELAKVVVLSIINGGKSALDEVRRGREDDCEFLDKFNEELKAIHKKFSKDPEFKTHKNKRVEAGVEFNHEASYMNTLLCDFENKILQTIHKAIGSPKDCVLCFDGLMIRKELDFDLGVLEKAVFDKLDIEIELVVKPMNEGFELENVKPYVPKAVNCFDFTDPYTYNDFHKKHNGNSADDDSIEDATEEYQRVLAHVLQGQGCYIKKLENGVFDVVSVMGSSDVKFKAQPSVPFSKVIGLLNNSFGEIRCVLDGSCSESNFNVWSGFQAKRVDRSESEGFKLMKSFIMEAWADNNQENYNYIISWFAGLVTNLTGINKIALAMVSGQGTGKGTLIEFMELVLRAANIISVAGIEKITGRFNTILQGKRLININEMSSTKDEFRSNFDKIKSYITDPTIMIEPKGVNAYSISNISNFIMFTNHEDAIVVEETDRRYAIFKMSSVYINNNEYFGKIRKECFNQDVADEFYTYLLDFPAVPLNMIPDTGLRRQMINMSKSSPLKFLDAINEEPDLKEAIFDGETRVKASVLYTCYKNWCSDNGERNVMTSTKFGTVVGTKLRKIKNSTFYYELI